MASILKVRDAGGTVHEIHSLQGKTAYQYAQEGGYIGSEEDFNAKMAQGNIPIPTSAEVGQTIVVKAVDASGKPTAWEAADMASGDRWELIADITLEEEVGNVNINKDTNGNAFLLKKFYILVNSEVPTSTPFTYIKTEVNGNKTISNNSSNKNTDKKRYFYCYAEFVPDVGALCWQNVSVNLYNNATNMQQFLRGYNQLYKEAGFYNLKIVPNDGSTLIGGVGTTVKVWGVRA